MYIQLTAGVSTAPVITEDSQQTQQDGTALYTVQGSGHDLGETSCKSSSSSASGNGGHAVLAGRSTVIFSQSPPSVPTLSVQAGSLVLPEA